MLLYKVKNDTNTLIKNELLTIEKIEKNNYKLNLFNEIDIPKSLVYFSFGAWNTDNYFDRKAGYYAGSCYPQIVICEIEDTCDGYNVYIIVNDYFYRKRKLHFTSSEKAYFTWRGDKYYLDDCLRV